MQAAADCYESAGRRLDQAQALEDAAVLLAGGGHSQRARSAAAAAAGLYRLLGADWDIRRLDSRMRSRRVRRGTGNR